MEQGRQVDLILPIQIGNELGNKPLAAGNSQVPLLAIRDALRPESGYRLFCDVVGNELRHRWSSRVPSSAYYQESLAWGRAP